MKWLNYIGGFAAAFVVPTTTVLSVLTDDSFTNLGGLHRNDAIAFWPSVAVLVFATIVATTAFAKRETRKSFRKPRPWHHLNKVPGAHAAASALGFEYAARSKRHKSKITDYMVDLLQNAGEATVFSRNLSWASDVRARAALMSLARDNNLTVYVHDPVSSKLSPLLLSLKAAGAVIFRYKHPGEHPSVRFTRVRSAGRTTFAIVQDEQGVHRIKEIHDSIDLAYKMADCLASIRVVRTFS